MFKNLFTYVYKYFAKDSPMILPVDTPAQTDNFSAEICETEAINSEVALNTEPIEEFISNGSPVVQQVDSEAIALDLSSVLETESEQFITIQLGDRLPPVSFVTRSEDILALNYTLSLVSKPDIQEVTSSESLSVTAPKVRVVGCYSLTKAGNTAAECEDAYAWRETENGFWFALSDGATESSFSREWAIELVNELTQRSVWQELGISPHLTEWLLPLQHNWNKWLSQQNLVWFAKRKAEQGTFATLTGLEINQNNQWQAFAVGDSCLFVVRDNQLLHSFPLNHSSELGYRPCLIGTIVQPELTKVVRYCSNQAQSGDRFYLVTDALASWIFTNLEINQDPWVQLNQLDTQTGFSNWVKSLRDYQAIPNDDTTMLHIEVQ